MLVIQSFSEYHDSSCSRLDALQNSRVERGRHVRGGTNRSSTGSLCKVRLSAGKKRLSSRLQSGKVRGETWAGLIVEIIPGCAVTVACLSCPDNSPVSPGPGRVFRNMLGWLQLEKTVRSPVWLSRGALQGENLLSSLDAAGDWDRATQRGRSLLVPRVLVRTRTGKAPLSGHTLESGAGHR